MARILLITASFLILAYQSNSQSQSNALHFDGIDDFIQVPNASSLLAGANQISISCWLKPENTAPSFPDFDGIIGFRNEIDFDFYILQLTGTTTEARFRNSFGVKYDLVTQGLVVNDWNHYVFTYDGFMIKLYINGQIADSTAASGTIINPSVTFNMGNLQYQIYNYYYHGSLDEVTLWNKALSAQEAYCIYKNEIDTLSTGLVLYYKFDQGKPNGNNTTITTAHDSKNNIDGFLNNFAMNGNTSNFANGILNYNVADTIICEGSSIVFGSQTITSIGQYSEVFQNPDGCDSSVYLTVIPAVDTSAKQLGFTITATVIGAQYQWVDCNNGFAAIPGANSQIYTATVNGTYAVLITENGCTDTSNCFTISGLSISENDLRSEISLFPNPVTDKLIIEFDISISDVIISLVNELGQTVIEDIKPNTQVLELNMQQFQPGVYFLHVCKLNQSTTFRIMKN